MKDSMDMKSLPKLGQTKRNTKGSWDLKQSVDKIRHLNSKLIKARNVHEARQIARYTQKANVRSAIANYEEQKARTRKAKRSGRGSRAKVLRSPFRGRIKYKGDRDDRY
jgi:hypothetical protein